MSENEEVLLIEPFYGGSHRSLMDALTDYLQNKCKLVTLSSKKWQWRSRVSALILSQVIPVSASYKVLFASSVLNLAELVALRPDLAPLRKILYFHENQLVYPVKKRIERDFQHGYNQILSSLVADIVVFNSEYNRSSFLSSIDRHLKLVPDFRPKGLSKSIAPKCRVIHFPVKFPELPHTKGETGLHVQALSNYDSLNDKNNYCQNCESLKLYSPKADVTISTIAYLDRGDRDDSTCGDRGDHNCGRGDPDPFTNKVIESSGTSHPVDVSQSDYSDQTNISSVDLVDSPSPLHIVWNHRWEHDKNPEAFFNALFTLSDGGQEFFVSVLGEMFADVPDIFHEAEQKLRRHILNWGFQEDKSRYYSILMDADVVVSTAIHEFFGISILEGVHCGCYPLCPRRLVYPEIYPDECLYDTDNQLIKRLRDFCKRPQVVRNRELVVDTSQYSRERLKDSYLELLTF